MWRRNVAKDTGLKQLVTLAKTCKRKISKNMFALKPLKTRMTSRADPCNLLKTMQTWCSLPKMLILKNPARGDASEKVLLQKV